ncbi:hypothetical protein BDV36DRAFT_250683 [Aspergillus pseudocaelatus]|uniref:Hydrophobin n=1 Tax=Aspergillus pseudocaelatus TaxID=1825620 RepID=A0ABQ6WS59_9EURO|nr:hypothetical protein BDV36DRAFT_250683 [Aspergillus pseudocaelatus]
MQSTLICFFLFSLPANNCQLPHNKLCLEQGANCITEIGDLSIAFPAFSIITLVGLIIAKAGYRSMRCSLTHSSLVVRLKPIYRG